MSQIKPDDKSLDLIQYMTFRIYTNDRPSYKTNHFHSVNSARQVCEQLCQIDATITKIDVSVDGEIIFSHVQE